MLAAGVQTLLVKSEIVGWRLRSKEMVDMKGL